MKTILIVEDEVEIAHLVQQLLEKDGFACHICRDGLDAMRCYQQIQPDLVILDLGLPGIDGLEVCTRMRKYAGSKDPYILMLTARAEEIDRVIGLSTGADDYVCKPFGPLELVARVRTLLRRSLRRGQHQIYATQHFKVNVEKHVAEKQIDCQTENLDLTAIEFNLLATFVSHPGQAWSRAQLIHKLWGDDFFGDDRVVDTHVARLRKKIELNPAQPHFIKTVTGIGYKFEDSAVEDLAKD